MICVLKTFWFCLTLWPLYPCRCHESVDRGLLKNLLRMLVDLQIYHDIFEIEFLHDTEAMYHAESLKMLRDPEFTVRRPAQDLFAGQSWLVCFLSYSYLTIWLTLIRDFHRRMTESCITFMSQRGESEAMSWSLVFPRFSEVNFWHHPSIHSSLVSCVAESHLFCAWRRNW